MTYSIKDVADMFQIPASTIRYYDKEGLLPYIERKATGYRIFTDEDINMLKLIECFKKTGMPIKDIRHYINLLKEGDSSLQERYEMMIARKKAVEEQMADLQSQMNVIEHKIDFYKKELEEKA